MACRRRRRADPSSEDDKHMTDQRSSHWHRRESIPAGLPPSADKAMQRNRFLSALAGAALLLSGASVHAQTIDSATVAGMKWRELGPANFEGRSSDIVGIPGPFKTIYTATAGRGFRQ